MTELGYKEQGSHREGMANPTWGDLEKAPKKREFLMTFEMRATDMCRGWAGQWRGWRKGRQLSRGRKPEQEHR